jgi:hypothetical protein
MPTTLQDFQGLPAATFAANAVDQAVLFFGNLA